MAKVFIICGKIGSGKTYYSHLLEKKTKAVLLSCDEILYDLFHHETGEQHDQIVKDIKCYLHKKAVQIVLAGTNVILDWGFWSKEERKDVSAYYKQQDIIIEWHYIDVTDEQWRRNIKERNQKVKSHQTKDYPIDEDLLLKLQKHFEKPDEDEMDVWYRY